MRTAWRERAMHAARCGSAQVHNTPRHASGACPARMVRGGRVARARLAGRRRARSECVLSCTRPCRQPRGNGDAQVWSPARDTYALSLAPVGTPQLHHLLDRAALRVEGQLQRHLTAGEQPCVPRSTDLHRPRAATPDGLLRGTLATRS
eukprot:199884-Prymnesium_polylepis.1